MSARRRLVVGIVAILWASLTLFAAMSDPKALSETKRLFGAMGGIGTVRFQGDTYWTKQVGVYSKECRESFTVFGAGLNTWEAAFFQVPSGTVKGPFSGTVQLKQIAYDDKAVVSWQFVFDGVVTSNRVSVPANLVQVSMAWDTRAWTNGVHVVCGFGVDSDGNFGRTRAFAVLIDQAQPSIGNVIDFSDPTGQQPLSPGQ